MIFAAGLVAAVSLGLGWVLQQRAAARAPQSELVSWRLLVHLTRVRDWRFGIAAMVCGQVLGAVALGMGAVALVEPLLSTNLLFAFVIAAAFARKRATRREIGGALLLSAALGVFIAVGDPHRVEHPSPPPIALAGLVLVVVVGSALVLVVVGRSARNLVVEAILLATAAGLMYGLQDAATQQALETANRHGVAALGSSIWTYVVVASAMIGILLSQSAFASSRLDHSLAPTAVAEPITGVTLGVAVFGNTLSVSPGALAVEAICVIAMIAGTVEIVRSPTLKRHHASARRSSADPDVGCRPADSAPEPPDEPPDGGPPDSSTTGNS
jgi:drug/metabolite transporter (DMT)-like permease